MNNVWAIAFRSPCRGANTTFSHRWPSSALKLLRDGAARRVPSISTAVARQRQQWLSRGFSTTSLQHAKAVKRNVKQRREAPRPSLTERVVLPTHGLSQATADTSESSGRSTIEVKKAEKAQVQLSEAQVATILGPGLTFDQGMDLLQELQYRRVTGSLADKGIDMPERSEFTETHRTRALDWLRENHPVDEEAAAAEYAEEMAEALRKQLEERARSLRLYKSDEAETEKAQEANDEEVVLDEHYDKIPVRDDQTRDITGESALVARKEYVEASRKKAKIEAEKQAEEMEARGEKPPEAYKGQALVIARKTAIEDASKRKHDRWQQLANEAELKEEDIFAKRSALSRLWAPTLFGLSVAGLSWLYAQSYEPPKSSMRLFPSISPATATVLTIAVGNLALVLLWRHPSAWKMMNRNFLLSPGHPHAFSVVGSLFSHQQFSHWMWNMSMLYIVGVPVHEEIGRGAFLSLYLSSGILGYLASLSYNVLTKSYLSATLGSSAAIFGLVGAYFTITESRKVRFPDVLGGEVEYQGWLPLATIVAWELLRWRMNKAVIDGAHGGTDYLTHLGGAAAGAVMGWLLRRKIEAEKAEDAMVQQRFVEVPVEQPTDAT